MAWMARAGQRWKLLVGALGIVSGGVGMALGWRLLALCSGPAYVSCRYDDRAMAYTLAGTAVGLASFVWLCVAPRCPKCGKRIVWWALSTKPVGGWSRALWELWACPGCGDAFDAVARTSPRF